MACTCCWFLPVPCVESRGNTNPPVHSPPRWLYLSINNVFAPARLAEIAAATPEGPPPTTRTSTLSVTGISLPGSSTVSALEGSASGLFADCCGELLLFGLMQCVPSTTAPDERSRRCTKFRLFILMIFWYWYDPYTGTTWCSHCKCRQWMP